MSAGLLISFYAACYARRPVPIEGNLIIRWHEQGFDVRFVPARAPGAQGIPTIRVTDPAALELLLMRLGLEGERVAEVLRSPYVLHSLRLSLPAGVARRVGLLPTWGRQALEALRGLVRGSARLVSRRRPRA
jgi:hypothetical protein